MYSGCLHHHGIVRNWKHYYLCYSYSEYPFEEFLITANDTIIVMPTYSKNEYAFCSMLNVQDAASVSWTLSLEFFFVVKFHRLILRETIRSCFRNFNHIADTVPVLLRQSYHYFELPNGSVAHLAMESLNTFTLLYNISAVLRYHLLVFIVKRQLTTVSPCRPVWSTRLTVPEYLRIELRR